LNNDHKCNIIPMPVTTHRPPYMSPRDIELLFGGVVRLMKKYADTTQIQEFIKALQDVIRPDRMDEANSDCTTYN